jgi:hypothetical protein
MKDKDQAKKDAAKAKKDAAKAKKDAAKAKKDEKAKALVAVESKKADLNLGRNLKLRLCFFTPPKMNSAIAWPETEGLYLGYDTPLDLDLRTDSSADDLWTEIEDEGYLPDGFVLDEHKKVLFGTTRTRYLCRQLSSHGLVAQKKLKLSRVMRLFIRLCLMPGLLSTAPHLYLSPSLPATSIMITMSWSFLWSQRRHLSHGNQTFVILRLRTTRILLGLTS